MGDVSIRDLRNRGGAIVDRVAAGEQVRITRARKVVAELRPVSGHALSSETVLGHWHRLPRIDHKRLREDVDSVADSSL